MSFSICMDACSVCVCVSPRPTTTNSPKLQVLCPVASLEGLPELQLSDLADLLFVQRLEDLASPRAASTAGEQELEFWLILIRFDQVDLIFSCYCNKILLQ